MYSDLYVEREHSDHVGWCQEVSVEEVEAPEDGEGEYPHRKENSGENVAVYLLNALFCFRVFDQEISRQSQFEVDSLEYLEVTGVKEVK